MTKGRKEKLVIQVQVDQMAPMEIKVKRVRVVVPVELDLVEQKVKKEK